MRATYLVSRTAGVALAFLGACPTARFAAQTIDTIVVVTHNVYDRKRDAPKLVARVGNALHIPTRAGVVRRTLLVKVGDRYDSAKVAESERALRALTIFRAVRIDTVRMDGRLALRVETDDAWSTIPDFDYASVAGDVMWAVAFTEANVAGTATALTGRYEKTPDRHSLSIGYSSTGVLGRRTVLTAQHKTISDGRSGQWSVGVPFYETVAPRSLTTDGAAATERVLRFLDGRLADSLQHREVRFGLAGGVALQTSPWTYTRLWVGAVWRREDFALAATVPFPRSQFGTVGAGLEFKRVRFQVLENFNAFARQEDVDVSQLLHLGFWAAPRAWGYGPGQAGIGPEARGQVSGLWRGGFAVFRGQAGGVVTGTGVDSVRVAGSVTVASQNLPRETLIFHLAGGVLRRPKPGDEFDLWRESNGPRLFGAHGLTGTRMVWLTLEDRVLVRDEVWGLLGVAVAPYLDWGGAWYADPVGGSAIAPEPARLGGDVGLALRLGPTRLTITDVGQFAFGYRFGAGLGGGALGLHGGGERRLLNRHNAPMTPAELLDFMRHHSLAVQASVSGTAAPQAAVVGFVVTDRFELFFDTLETTRKVWNLRRNPQIAFVIGGQTSGDERTVQYEGLADEPAGAELTRLKELYFKAFPDGPERQGWAGITYVRARPTWIRYSDFNRTPPQIVEFTAGELGAAG